MGCATRRFASVGIFLLFCASAVSARTPEPIQRIAVRVYDHAGVHERTLEGASRELARIFARLEIGIDWVLCYRNDKVVDATCNLSPRPSELHLSLVDKVPRQISGWTLSPGGCGFAVLTGETMHNRRATVFHECILRTASETKLSTGIVLAHVAAHEIAHLLIGTNEHSALGLFRARLGPEDWQLANYGRLEFAPADAIRLRTAVAFRLRPPDAAEWARALDVAPTASPQ